MAKKILLIHTGGTIGMVRDETEGYLRPDRFFENLRAVIPELTSLAEIETEIPFVFDSAELNFAHWQKLAAIIQARAGNIDGVVVLHGTDTLAYTASALSYMLANPPLPVVLTGAQKPLADLRTDARANLIDAVQLATEPGIREVAVFFDSRLMRGNRVTKSHITHFDAFSSPNYPLLAQVGIDIEVFEQNLLRPAGLFHVFDHFDRAVAVLKLFPGIDCSWFQPGPEVRAVLIIGFGAGTLPLQSGDLLGRVERWISQGKLVVLMSEAKAGRADPSLYESGSRLLDLGVLPTADMTFEAAITKIMFLLGQFTDPSLIRQNFTRPLAGEMSS